VTGEELIGDGRDVAFVPLQQHSNNRGFKVRHPGGFTRWL
jgi:hypothetical protein